VALGPFGITIESTGLRIGADFPADRSGNLGPVDAALGWKPPTGLGVAVESEGIVSGSGFLAIDPDAGEYAGALELRLLEVGVAAIGLVETKLPGGGWSLFLALFLDVPSIPLGFGFTLNGVGGLAGVNRTIDVEALQSAVRSGALDSVLFPEDPIADAPFIIDQLRAIFPSAVDRYVFGPVVKIGWCVPPLIEAEVGIVISIPDPITVAVLGSVTSLLPTRELDLVALHLDVAGVIDSAAATLSIDASLHDSSMVGYSLSGDMALRASFGDQPSFLMALGGFHPGFDPPSGFPRLARLSLGIDAGDVLDIRFDAYLAIASNSLQFGAAFELRADVEGFGVRGGAEFDALVMLSPFLLDTHLGFHIAVTGAGVDLASAWLDTRLTGPNPWHVVGTATLKVLGLEQGIRIDERIGHPRPEPPPSAEDVLGQLRAALALPEAWSVASGGGSGVVLAADAEADDHTAAVAPDGLLGVSQRVVPLAIQIDKSVSSQIVGDYDWFDLEADGAGMASTGTISDWFAPASYTDLTSRERLTAPSFERLKSGIEFGGADATAGPAREVTLKYEQILRDPELERDHVALPPIDLERDSRLAVMVAAPRALLETGFAIAEPEVALKVRPPKYVAADRLTGAVLERGSWSETRLSVAGRDPATTIAPSWEVSA
jgi:uncharacterized protein DUF6603